MTKTSGMHMRTRIADVFDMRSDAFPPPSPTFPDRLLRLGRAIILMRFLLSSASAASVQIASPRTRESVLPACSNSDGSASASRMSLRLCGFSQSSLMAACERKNKR